MLRLSVAAFQFHKGTIKTGNRKKRMFNPKTFQFHKGTIKTEIYSQITFM